MPRYDYACKECRAEFFVQASMTDRRDDMTCPHCCSTDVRRLYNTINFGKGTRTAADAAVGSSSGGCACSPHGCGCHP